MTASLPSRGVRGYAGGVLAGIFGVVLFAAAYMQDRSVGIFLTCFMLSYFSSVPLFLTGLGAGVGSSVAALGAGVAALCLIKQPAFAVLFAVLYGLPVIGLTRLALRKPVPVGRGERNILMAITLYPCGLFLAAVVATAKYKGGLLALTTGKMNEMFAPIKNQPNADPAMVENFMNALQRVIPLSPALIGCTWMILMLLGIIIAQSILKQQGWNLRPDFALASISIPSWLVFAAAATGLAGTFAHAPFDYIGTNLCIMLCVPFFFVGLAVVHVWAATTKAKIAILIGFYAILTVLVWSSLLVAGLGAFDQWFNFRQRLAGKQQGG
jgi:hypothetical protein